MNAQRTHGVHNKHPRSPKRSSGVSQQQSLNHLLNFSLPPRVQHVPATPRRSKRSHHAVWNPERFINAQYRFVMSPTGDYTVHFADPDIYFQWQDIVQVIIARPPEDEGDSGAQSNCPICLSPPIAPRMTRCGHIFCYPCILHYIETGDTPKWHRCPICFDSITVAQLKAVRWSLIPSSTSITAGHIMPMRLIQRPHITNMALPRSDTWHAESQAGSDLLQPHEAPFHFLPDVEEFAHFMLASPERLILDITGEIGDLDREESTLANMGDELGVIFVILAREKCFNALAKAQEMEQDALLRIQIERKRNLLRDAVVRAETHRQREIHDSELRGAPATPNYLGGDLTGASASRLIDIHATGARTGRNRRNLNPPPHSSSSYYFYQAASGANIFLHPLDIRILLAHFGNYASFPNEISAVITHASESTVDDDLRRRCKYLAHLPEGADVAFLELDLENVVGKESLKPFENLLKVRRTRHKERMKKEEKARLRAEEKERDNAFSSIAAPNPPLEHESEWLLDSHSPPLVIDGAPEGQEQPIEDSNSPRAPVAPSASGAWGARSFASAVQSTANPAQNPAQTRGGTAPPNRRSGEDDWEIDQAWYELEEAQSKGSERGKRGRQKKLVLLGSGGGGRRY